MARECEIEGGIEVMKNVSFLRLYDMCLINEKRKKGRKVSFYSPFYNKEECRNTVDIQRSLVEELGEE